ncbi:5'/3'-nucleotidase SurE [Kitasatospora sp. NPDC052896]|uniref:5'/3'-nucleotidase SurE n=1 Tax=Kitasatospora sp. NPDC052896 TaxID=3364061 RepID=UPI0037C8D529
MPVRRPRVLVTNDDGVAAEGLRRLAAFALEQGLDVLVAAPGSEASGSGTSRAVPAGGLVRVDPVNLPGLPGISAHAVAGPPALIVTAACQGIFGAPPELVLSGINPGANVGNSVLHSGTVGAVLTAARYGCPGAAVSIDIGAELHWQTALVALERVLPVVLPGSRVRDRPPVVLNVNAPALPPDELRGIRAVGPGGEPAVRFSTARVDSGSFRVSYRAAAPAGAGGDVGALAAGYATVTALRTVQEDLEVPLPVPRFVPGHSRHPDGVLG